MPDDQPLLPGVTSVRVSITMFSLPCLRMPMPGKKADRLCDEEMALRHLVQVRRAQGAIACHPVSPVGRRV